MSEVERQPLRWGRDAYGNEAPWHEGIREMCQYGVRQVRAGHYKELKFELFGARERDMVCRVMRDIAPDVGFSTSTVLTGRFL